MRVLNLSLWEPPKGRYLLADIFNYTADHGDHETMSADFTLNIFGLKEQRKLLKNTDDHYQEPHQ